MNNFDLNNENNKNGAEINTDTVKEIENNIENNVEEKVAVEEEVVENGGEAVNAGDVESTDNAEDSQDTENADNTENTENTENILTSVPSSEDEGEADEDQDVAEEDEEDEDLKKTKQPNESTSFLRGLFDILEMVCISVAFVVLIVTFFFRFTKVDGESMTYTINENDTLLVSMSFYKPEKGDIVIFQAPDYDINKPLVKRVIATEGDTLEINFSTWEVKVNGRVVDEYYVRYHPYLPDNEDDAYKMSNPDYEMAKQSVFDIKEGSYDSVRNVFTAVIPEGKVFAMGDNRNNSHDSRSADIGMVDERFIVGKVILRISPFDAFGIVD